MEVELGAPCSRAVILSKPVLCPETDKVAFSARFNYSKRMIDAEVEDKKLLDLEPGDEIYLSGFGDETCGDIIRHNKFMRWFILTFC